METTVRVLYFWCAVGAAWAGATLLRSGTLSDFALFWIFLSLTGAAILAASAVMPAYTRLLSLAGLVCIWPLYLEITIARLPMLVLSVFVPATHVVNGPGIGVLFLLVLVAVLVLSSTLAAAYMEYLRTKKPAPIVPEPEYERILREVDILPPEPGDYRHTDS